MQERFLKSKRLQAIAGTLLAAIILLLVFVVVPAMAGGGVNPEVSQGGATGGAGFGIAATAYGP